MKLRRSLVLPVVLASLLLSGPQVSPASAAGATLCQANETPCASDYSTGTEIKLALAAGTKLKKFIGETLAQECSEVSAAGNTANTGGEVTPVEVPLSSLNVGGCNTCSFAVSKRGTLAIESIPGTMNAKVRWTGFEFTESCFGGTDCVYASEASKGIFLRGGGEATLSFEAAAFAKTSGSGSLCLDKKWTGTFAISTPKPLYVSGPTSESFAGGGVLCRLEGCLLGSRYGTGTPLSATLKTGTVSVLNAGFPEVECEGSSMNGEVLDPGSSTEPVVGAWSAWTFSGCNCKVTVPKAGNFSVDWTSGSSGAMVLSGFEIKANCGGKECVFGSSAKEGIALAGGSPALIKAEGAPVPKLSGIAECESTGKWNAEYEVAAPKPLLVAKE